MYIRTWYNVTPIAGNVLQLYRVLRQIFPTVHQTAKLIGPFNKTTLGYLSLNMNRDVRNLTKVEFDAEIERCAKVDRYVHSLAQMGVIYLNFPPTRLCRQNFYHFSVALCALMANEAKYFYDDGLLAIGSRTMRYV